jgi:hypothetical protein
MCPLNVGHRPGVITQPELTENGVPNEADQLMGHYENPNCQVIDSSACAASSLNACRFGKVKPRSTSCERDDFSDSGRTGCAWLSPAGLATSPNAGAASRDSHPRGSGDRHLCRVDVANDPRCRTGHSEIISPRRQLPRRFPSTPDPGRRHRLAQARSK